MSTDTTASRTVGFVSGKINAVVDRIRGYGRRLYWNQQRKKFALYRNYRPSASGLDPEGEGRKLVSDVFRPVDVSFHSRTAHFSSGPDIERAFPEPAAPKLSFQ